jgi:Tfp pilus assembly protein PilV
MLKVKGQRLNSGQSLFEVVLALGVITTIIVGVVSLTANSIRNSVYSRNKTLANRYAGEATEWLRSERDADFVGFQAHTTASVKYCLKNLNWNKVGDCSNDDKIAETSLFRDVAFTNNLVDQKTIIEADVRVYWHDAQGDHEVISATNFSDWRQR